MENYIINKLKNIPIHLKVTFVSAFVLALLVHGVGFFHNWLNEDSLFYLRNSMAYLYQLGRWFLVALQYIRGFYTVPWLIGITATVFLAGATTLMVSVLGVTNKIHCVLIALLTVTFPAWANQFMYDFLADAYPAAMLLAVLAVYYTRKYRFGFIAGAFSLMFSLALYQSFLSFAIGLSILLVIRYLLEGERTLKEILRYGGKFLLCGVLGLIFYVISVQVSLWITGGELFSYQGMDALGQISLSELPQLIWDSYRGVFHGFYRTGPDFVENALYVSHALFAFYALLFLIMVYLLARAILANKLYRNLPAFLCLGLCLLLFPLGLNIIVITAPTAEAHILTTNAFLLGIFFVFVLLDIYKPARQALAAVVLALSLLIGGNYWVQSGTFYFVQHMQYEHTMAFYNRLVMRIESTPGYEPGMPISIVGEVPFYDLGTNNVLSDRQRQIVGFDERRPVIGLGDPYKFFLFTRNYLGLYFSHAAAELEEAVIQTPEFAAMPLYPRDGSIAIIDGVLVVRLSETS
ncbi:MAG: glucosyltransferase domain-containing protein [Oscillospiraceae bacterium]|nr:glucosyltransferase domain-containing protein [Oscillospiraceae bacterium]